MNDAHARAELSQRLAADPEASAFVTANAGSGKTKVLIDRVARLLLRGDKPSAFLCITYTKAAAAEMRRRLFERLGDWAVASDEKLNADLRLLIGAQQDLPAGELSKARALFAHALETPGGLKIQTIHSFCERLLRRFPLEAGVAPGFEVLDETQSDSLMARTWADIVGRDGPTRALEQLARRLDEGRLDDLISALNARRRALRAALHERSLAEALTHLRDRHGARQDREDFLAAFHGRTPWREMEAAADRLVLSSANDVAAADRIAAAKDADAEARFDFYGAVFLTDRGEPRANVITKKFAGENPALAALFADEQARVTAARAALKAIERAEDCAALLTLGDGLLHAYGRAKTAIGALDFEDLIERAEAVLTRAGAAPWVLYKLDGGLDHILIDEGQDTSPAQWALLAPLQGEFFVGAGARAKTRTVFAVGDAKQSIYSFQGADSARFLAESQSLSARAAAADLPFHAPDMTMSFRSTPTVLTAVDAVFEDLPLLDGEPAASNIIRHDARRVDDVGLVELWPLAPRPEQPEQQAWSDPVDSAPGPSAAALMAEAIARRVAEWINGGAQVWDKGGAPRAMSAGDVIALVRTRGAVFDALLKAFRQVGLPFAGADRMLLKDEIAVQDLLAFARVALDPGDDLAIACALKSPLIGLGDDDLMTLAGARGKGERVIDRLRAAPHYAEAAALIDETIAAGGDHPFDFFARLLEGLDSSGLSGWRRMLERLGRAARDPLEEVLSRALADRNPPSVQRFVCTLEADDTPVKREMEAGQDAVRVMTVHGAKGLEAPVVILADTTGPFENRDIGLLLSGDELYWSPSKSEDDEATARVRAATQEAARREHLRLLYVAMTRARDRLIVCGHTRGNLAGGRAAGSWHELVEEGLAEIAKPIDTPFGQGLRLGEDKRIAAAPTTTAAPAPLPAWIARPAPTAPRRVQALAPSRLGGREPPGFSARALERRRFRRGRLIHGLMQRLPDIAPAQRRAAGEAWLKSRMAAGEDGAGLISEALAVLADPRFAAVFGPGSRAEAPLVGEVRGQLVSGIIDRLVIGPKEALILDFKTDRPAPANPEAIPAPYLAQLGLYRRVLAKAFPGRAIRCALLWTEAPALMEAPAGAMERAVDALLVEA